MCVASKIMRDISWVHSFVCFSLSNLLLSHLCEDIGQVNSITHINQIIQETFVCTKSPYLTFLAHVKKIMLHYLLMQKFFQQSLKQCAIKVSMYDWLAKNVDTDFHTSWDVWRLSSRDVCLKPIFMLLETFVSLFSSWFYTANTV